jgi:16S rRNA C1402 (ribose-2'-O) methylase RsmI
MGCERMAMANDPGAHLIARMDRLQVNVSHINGSSRNFNCG